MAETPNEPPALPSGSAEPLPAPPPPAEPVALDLTKDESPKSAEKALEGAIKEIVDRTGQTVSEVTRQIGTDASFQLRSQAKDKEPPYAPRDRAQDSARQIITLWLIGLFCVLIVLAFAALFMIGLKSGFNQGFFEKLKSLLDVLLGPVITLLSSAIGFYFGYQQGAGTLNKDAPREDTTPKPRNGQ